jgi:thymidylate kinase
MIIAVEGIDASGKNTQTKLLADRLHGEVIAFPDYTTTAGDAILGNLKGEWSARISIGMEPQCLDEQNRLSKVREQAESQLNAMVLQSLMTINRIELMPRVGELRMRNKHVVFDRYYGSALVYGGLDGLEEEWIARIQAPLPEPDAWVLIDIPPEESVRRRPERRDRYEKQPGLMGRVRQSYLSLFKRQGAHWHVVDGLGTVEEVHERVWYAIKSTVPMPTPSSTFTF